MKNYLVLFVFILILTGLFFIENETKPIPNVDFTKNPQYQNGLLKSEYYKVSRRANYNLDVLFNPDSKTISVAEEIIWINKTDTSTSEIQFHMYANAYKSNKTLFAQAYPLNEESQTQLKIKSFTVNGIPEDLIYFQPDIVNKKDSTVAKVKLDSKILPGDTVRIYFSYTMKIPRSVKRMGHASGRNFFFVSQWFPKVGVFENGKWICSQYHPYLNYYSDFGDYNVKIKVPKDYIVAATGVEKDKAEGKKYLNYNFVQSGVHDFVWLATDDILKSIDTYTRKDGSKILIQAYIQPERENFTERYITAVKRCLEYFENKIGIYPYQTISLVDVPRTSASGGMEYPTLFTVSAELFSRFRTGQPEYLVTHEFAHQFFHGLIANNEVYEAWLDEGFTSYIATKIMYYTHPEILETFKFASYIPIYGLNFLSYNEIPLIYTLAEIQIPIGARSVNNYYRNLTMGTMADTSFKLPTRLSYVVNSYNKPELVLHTLERYLGEDRMMKILRAYYDNFKYKHPKANDFISLVQNYSRSDMTWFFNEFYRTAKIFDYKVSGINKLSANIYEVIVERLGDGIFKNEVYLITEQDTIKQTWNGRERWHKLYFKTKNEVIAAEIDPLRKNLLDINFANNSYTVTSRVWASLSLATRLFFWIQNAIMILGSIG